MATATRVFDAIVMELEQEAQATRRVLERVPNDKLDWRPHPKSWTLGQLALHVATVPGSVAGMSQQSPFEVAGRVGQQDQPKSTQEILDTFEKSLADAKAIYNAVDDTAAFGSWKATLNGKQIMELPRIGVARAIGLNHWYHHRGQLTVYLRMLNVPLPSVYGPTADENPFM